MRDTCWDEIGRERPSLEEALRHLASTESAIRQAMLSVVGNNAKLFHLAGVLYNADKARREIMDYVDTDCVRSPYLGSAGEGA